MGLFDHIADALNNPNQQASSEQLSNIINVVSQLSGRQSMDSSTTNALIGVVGKHVRSALRQRSQSNQTEVESLVNQYSGVQANPNSVQSIFSPEQQQSTVEDAANKTGIDAQTIQTLLPTLIPVVLSFLQSGATKGPSSGNSVLSAFLDSDRDGDVDLGDAISVAGQFIQNRG